MKGYRSVFEAAVVVVVLLVSLVLMLLLLALVLVLMPLVLVLLLLKLCIYFFANINGLLLPLKLPGFGAHTLSRSKRTVAVMLPHACL